MNKLRCFYKNIFLNDTINKFELEKVLNREARKTELKLLVKSTTNSKKCLLAREQKIFSSFAKLDIKIIEKLLNLTLNFQFFFIN